MPADFLRHHQGLCYWRSFPFGRPSPAAFPFLRNGGRGQNTSLQVGKTCAPPLPQQGGLRSRDAGDPLNTRAVQVSKTCGFLRVHLFLSRCKARFVCVEHLRGWHPRHVIRVDALLDDFRASFSGGVAKERWFVLLFRFLGWVAVYFLPVHLVAVGNLRGFNVHGSIPDNSALVCLRTEFRSCRSS